MVGRLVLAVLAVAARHHLLEPVGRIIEPADAYERLVTYADRDDSLGVAPATAPCLAADRARWRASSLEPGVGDANRPP